MPITVDCSCGKHFNVRDEYAGSSVTCQMCQATIMVPAVGAAVAPAAVAAPIAAAPADNTTCPYCAESIPRDQPSCPLCGESLRDYVSGEKLRSLLADAAATLDVYTANEDNLAKDRSYGGGTFTRRSAVIGVLVAVTGALSAAAGQSADRTVNDLAGLGFFFLFIFGIVALVMFCNDIITRRKKSEKPLTTLKRFFTSLKTNRAERAFIRLAPTGRRYAKPKLPDVEKVVIDRKPVEVDDAKSLRKHWGAFLLASGAQGRTSVFSKFRIVEANDRFALCSCKMKLTSYNSAITILLFLCIGIFVIIPLMFYQKRETLTVHKLLICSGGQWYVAEGEFSGILDDTRVERELSRL